MVAHVAPKESASLPFGAPPGVDLSGYYPLLAELHARLRPRTYLEIGVRDGASLRLAAPTTRCVGVDPAPQCDGSAHANLVLVEETSDRFFETYRPADLVGRSHYDLVFIDGMHLFEFALRDFANAERQCSRSSSIVLHDCVPLNAGTALRERETAFWSGDTWKLLPALREHRPDLKIDIFDVPPTGLAVISHLDPSSATLGERMPEILRELLPLSFDDYLATRKPCDACASDLDLAASELLCRRVFHWKERRLGRTIPRLGGRRPPGASAACSEPPCSVEPPSRPAPLAQLNPVPLPPAKKSAMPRMLGVLLCYNDADILPDAIESLLENGHDLVVWDHGSTDETASVLDRFAGHFVERTFLPREFDFYELYPTVSRHLIQRYAVQYDWISWPDQDELLEGPDRSRSYPEYVAQVLEEGYSHVHFDNFNYWFSSLDDETIGSPAKRIRHYCLFPDCPPRVRGWRACVTNERLFNHNPLPGKLFPRNFRLRHYPARSYERTLRRILVDRAGLQRESAPQGGKPTPPQNRHYNAMARKLGGISIDRRQLHFDDGTSDLHTAVTYDWKTIYR